MLNNTVLWFIGAVVSSVIGYYVTVLFQDEAEIGLEIIEEFNTENSSMTRLKVTNSGDVDLNNLISIVYIYSDNKDEKIEFNVNLTAENNKPCTHNYFGKGEELNFNKRWAGKLFIECKKLYVDDNLSYLIYLNIINSESDQLEPYKGMLITIISEELRYQALYEANENIKYERTGSDVEIHEEMRQYIRIMEDKFGASY